MSSNTGRSLTYEATGVNAGKPGTFALEFFCDTTFTPSEKGAIGFNLRVNKVSALAPFSFVDFEGPEAPAQARKLVTATVQRTGQPPLVFRLQPSGSFVDADAFTFSVAEVTGVAKSDPKSLLKALAAPQTGNLQIVVTDFRDAKRTLEFSIPVAGREREFGTLLTGVK